jgi:hypothetical protein
MLKKLDLTNTAQLIRFAVDHGICGPSAAVRRPRDPSPGNGHAPRNGDARPTPAH